MTETISARRTQTRDRLIDAALEVIADEGVGGASVEHICDVAGFTRGAFYSNFESKEGLCLAVLERQADENLEAARVAIASLDAGRAGSSTDFDDLVADAIKAYLAAQRSDRTWVLASSELRLFAVRQASLRGAYLAHARRVSGIFAQLVSETAARFGYALTVPEDEVVPVLHAVYEHGAISALIAGEDVAGPIRAAQLGAVLRAMLRPVGG